MLIEIKIKIGHDSMFNIPQTNFKSAHLLNKIVLVQFQCSRTVHQTEASTLARTHLSLATGAGHPPLGQYF